jgi:hypothetical protein
MPKITASAPILLARDVAASAQHFRECVGFERVDLFGEPTTFVVLE